ncbi:MAG: linear amide C-N hydrolase [Actinophytocola sp.]|uniref:linear amide C-N hydrolase n=1 Tax=Actinophytocola sp. TaxID=1872138 RepID=UPI001323CAFD|nr:linear amide C-N hydrolase [Actinophytocola sp.]MPZ85047.1 linear amide C-N hydrolase [Actinophytocola sp.]
MRRVAMAVVLMAMALAGCQSGPAAAPSPPAVWDGRDASLATLEQLDDHPLWTMRYAGGYDRLKDVTTAPPATPFGCSLFATNDAANPLFARNFDWAANPAMLLFTEPPDGYASVSMVDLSYLGVTDPAADPARLADAPLLPFDGLNAKGLAIGLAAVPDAQAASTPSRPTVGGVRIIRLVLDQAATVEEAVAVFEDHNIDFSGGPPLHYLIADATGKSVVVEFVAGTVSALPAQTAVNFTMAGSDEATRQSDSRYATANGGLRGARDWRGAMDLLGEVVQGHTQWSVVYGLESGEVHLATDKKFDRVHEFSLPMTG